MYAPGYTPLANTHLPCPEKIPIDVQLDNYHVVTNRVGTAPAFVGSSHQYCSAVGPESCATQKFVSFGAALSGTFSREARFPQVRDIEQQIGDDTIVLNFQQAQTSTKHVRLAIRASMWAVPGR